MSRFWPHGSYDEDQPLAHTILWVHVLTRAETSGAGFGAIAAASIYGLRNFNMIKGPTGSREFQRLLLKSTGNGTAIGFGMLVVGMPFYMRGQQEIQWKDRTWRILENKGQLEVDDWTYSAIAAGTIAMAARPALRMGLPAWQAFSGAVGLASFGGMFGYMGWRYGMREGKFEEAKEIII